MQSQAYITFVIFGACLMIIKLIGPTVKATDHRLCLFSFSFLYFLMEELEFLSFWS